VAAVLAERLAAVVRRVDGAVDLGTRGGAVRAALAGGESMYDEAQTHLQNFQSLSQQVDSTTNLKDAADLQNRMSAELGMAQSAQTKLQAINANLTANQLNDSNQAAAVRAKFFQTTSP